MPEEFEGDLAGAVFWGADLSGARFRDVNLTDAHRSATPGWSTSTSTRWSTRSSSTASTSRPT